MFRKFLIIATLFILAGCGGEENQVCIPASTTGKTASGVEQSSAAEIFTYLRDKKIISTIILQIKEEVIGTSSSSGGAAKNMFTSFTSSDSFQSGMMAAFTLAILFYGVGVATGIIQTQLGDALIRMGKIIFISIVATNWEFFYDNVGGFFITTTDELMYYMMANFGELYAQGPSSGLTSSASMENLFADIDLFFAQLFSIHTVAIVMALISPNGGNAGPYSNIYALFLIFSLYQVSIGLLRVTAIYAFSLFARALLFALAPIFFCFMLFNQTKALFDAWIRQMISYTLQPVILSAFLGIFIAVLSSLFKELYALKVCWATPQDKIANGWHFVDPITEEILPTGRDAEPPISLESLLMLFFFAWMFSSYLKLAEKFGQAIAQSTTGTLGDAIAISKHFNR